MSLRSGVVLFALALPLGGCSSLLASIFGRPIQSDPFNSLETDTSIMTMQGQYRVATVRHEDSKLRVCAESLPDAASAIGGRSTVDVAVPTQAGARSVGVDDQFQTALLQTFNRTETADVVRQLGWQACQAWASNGITNREYFGLLKGIAQGAYRVLEKRATGAPAIAAGTVQVNMTARPAPGK